MAIWPARGETPWDDKLKAYIDEGDVLPPMPAPAAEWFPRTPSGRWLWPIGYTFVTNQPAPNTGGFCPFRVLRTQEFSAAGTVVVTVGAGETIQCAMYDDDGNGYPGAKLAETAVTPIANGIMEIPFIGGPVEFSQGLKWVWAYVSGTATRMTVTSHTAATEPAVWWHSSPSGSATTVHAGGYVMPTGTTPPAVAPPDMAVTRYLPMISLRAT